jgi:hypothetical protein
MPAGCTDPGNGESMSIADSLTGQPVEIRGYGYRIAVTTEGGSDVFAGNPEYIRTETGILKINRSVILRFNPA